MLALIGMLIIAFGAYLSVARLDRYAGQSQETAEVIATLRKLLSLATDAETAQRGFALTGDESYVEPYDAALSGLDPAFATLRQLAADEPERLARIDGLEALIRERVALARRNIEARRHDGFDAVRDRIASGEGKRLHDRIRQQIAMLEAEEDQQLQLRLEAARSASAVTRIVIALSSFAMVLLVVVALRIMRREFASTAHAEAELQRAYESLEHRVLERTEALARSHAAVQASEARIASIIESAMDGIVAIDEDNRYVMFNAAAEHILGFRAEDVLGRTVDCTVEPQALPGYLDRLQRFREGSQATLRPAQHEYARRGDGELIPIEVSLSRSRIEGRTIVTMMLRDIRQRLAAEQALRLRERQLTQVTDLLPGPVSRIDRDGRYVFANAAYLRWFGKRPEEVVGRTIPEVVGEAFYQRVRHHLLRASQGERVQYDVAVETPTHGTLYAEARLVPDLDEHGKPIGYFIVYIDVTVRVEAEAEILRLNADLERRVQQRTEELAAANRELEAFSYSVSHDLRAPLRAVNGFSKILLQSQASRLDEDGRHHLELIRKSGVHMGQLIDDLLAFSRYSRQPLKRREVQPEELVQQCLEALQEERANRSIEITLQTLPSCLGDPALLRQVWLNLIANALKYTRRREHACIDIGHDESLDEHGRPEVAYFVRDNGVGFDMRYSEKLFGVFHRLHRMEDYEGTGVGLAITQRIIHRHGGRIWAEAAPEQGACFHFTIGNDST